MERSDLRFENFCFIKGVNVLYKGCTIAVQKKFFFFGELCLTNRTFLVLVLLSASVERCLVLRMRNFFCLFLDLLKFFWIIFEVTKVTTISYGGHHSTTSMA